MRKFYPGYFFCVLFVFWGELIKADDFLRTLRVNSSISLSSSTVGIGLSGNYRLNKSVAFRLGYFRGAVKVNYYTSFNGNQVMISNSGNLGMLSMFADFYPVEDNLFRISTGIAINNNEYSGRVKSRYSQKFGLIEYTPEQIGSIQVNVHGNRIAPYLGFGFGRAVPRKRINLGADFGFFYHGKHEFEIDANGVFAPSESDNNTALLKDAFKFWTFFPFVSIQISYALK